MSGVELTKMSSRGQVVIPREIREKMHLKEGEAFAVVEKGDTLMLKRIKTPSKEELLKEWQQIVEKGNKEAKKLGVKEKDVSKMIHTRRGIKE